MSLRSVNPATGEEFARVPLHAPPELERRLDLAVAAFERQRRSALEARAERLLRAAELLEQEKQRWGELMTREMGKPISAAVAEAEKCAWVCRHYAQHGAAMVADEVRQTDAQHAFIRYQPIGAVLAIMPWNFPFWQVFRFAAPALFAGNVGLLKHASNVPQCALAIEEILQRAGFDGGEFQALLVKSAAVDAIIADPRIRAVTLTGSEAAGSAVGAAAGKVLKKSVLELGGSDPFVVMPSADLEQAARTAVTARVLNNGQSCIAAKRFIVHEQVFDAFSYRFTRALQTLVIGDPMDPRTQLGPLATAQLRDELAQQVERTVQLGGHVLTGGRPLERAGWYYAPTALTDIPPGSPAADEELFGPVASLFRARDLDHAIELANATRFGLGASAWTTDAHEQRRFIDELQAGLVFINSMVASDPRLPFGGVKASGYGRELDVVGIREFLNIKSVSISDEAALVE